MTSPVPDIYRTDIVLSAEDKNMSGNEKIKLRIGVIYLLKKYIYYKNELSVWRAKKNRMSNGAKGAKQATGQQHQTKTTNVKNKTPK